MRLRRITRNTTSRTRNILKHSRKARGGSRSKRKPGNNKALWHRHLACGATGRLAWWIVILGRQDAYRPPQPRWLRSGAEQLGNLYAFGRSSFGVKIAQAFCHRADLAISNLAIVQPGDRSQLA